MTINALQSAPSPNTPTTGTSQAYPQRNSSSNAVDTAAASAAAVQSTQVTLSASASLSFYDIPSSLGVELTPQSNPWNIQTQQSGSTPQTGSSLLGQFAENELASQLSSPSALAGATITMNSFSSQSTNNAGYAQETSSGQGGEGSATVLEASNSVTLQGSGDITLADGEVIPFNATLSTSASVVEGSATQTSGGATTSSSASPTSNAPPVNLNSSGQTPNVPDSSSTQPASTSGGTSVTSEWTKMLQEYKLLLNLFDTVNAAVQNSQAPPSTASSTSNNGSFASTQSSAENTVAGTGAVAT